MAGPEEKGNPDADATAVLRLDVPKPDAKPAFDPAGATLVPGTEPAPAPDDQATAMLRLDVPPATPAPPPAVPPPPSPDDQATAMLRVEVPDSARITIPERGPGSAARELTDSTTAPRPAPPGEDQLATAMRKVPTDEDTTGVAPPRAAYGAGEEERTTTRTEQLPDEAELRTETASIGDLGLQDEVSGPTPVRVAPVPQGYARARDAAARTPPPSRPPPRAAPAPAAPVPGRPAASFIVKEPHAPRRRINMLGDRLVVGREASCDVVLTDPKVSKRHCELAFRGAELWVRDLGTTNGLLVNKRHTLEARLYDGDLLVLGDSAITANVVRPDQRADARPAADARRRRASRIWIVGAVTALLALGGAAAALVLFERRQRAQEQDRAALSAFLDQAWLAASGDPCEELSDGVLRIASRLDRDGHLKPELREDLLEIAGRMTSWLDMAGPAAQLASDRAAALRAKAMNDTAGEFAGLIGRRVGLALTVAEEMAMLARASERPPEEQPRPEPGKEPGRKLRDLLAECRRFQGEFAPRVDALARELNELH